MPGRRRAWFFIRGEFHVLRSRRHRHRPRRLCLRHSRRAARPEDRRGRKAQDAWRHLPQYRLHSLQGAAARLGNVRGGRRMVSTALGVMVGKPKLDLAAHDEAQGRHGRGQCARASSFPVQEEQGRRVSWAPARIAAPRQGRGDRRGRLEAGARDQEHRHRHRLGRDAACPASTIDEKQRRLLDRRARARKSSAEADRRRRRRDRPGTRLGLAPARRAK